MPFGSGDTFRISRWYRFTLSALRRFTYRFYFDSTNLFNKHSESQYIPEPGTSHHYPSQFIIPDMECH